MSELVNPSGAGVTDGGTPVTSLDGYTLLTGRATPQQINLGTASGASTGYISSTSNSTKGKYFLNSAGTIAIDELNTRLGVGVASPAQAVDVNGSILASSLFRSNSGLSNNSSSNNSRFQSLTNGAIIDRNIADGNPSLIVQQIHASSTGDILRLKNSSLTPFIVDIDGQIISASPSTAHSLKITPSGNTSGSTTTGGAVLIDNTSNNGSGLLLYSNHAGSATGRIMDINIANTAFNKAGFHMDYAGTENAMEISNTSTDTSAQALNVVSTNPNDTTVGISGQETSKGTLKVTHTGTGSDSSASALSLRANGTGTAAQGIFFDAEDGGTTGALIKMRNNGVDKFIIDSAGVVYGASVASGNLTIASTTNATKGKVLFGTSAYDEVNNRLGLGTASPAEVLDVTGNLNLNTAGNGIKIKEGSNATMGLATLVGGTVTVSTTKVTANSRIFLTVQSLGTVATPKALAVTNRTASTSFVITSADATDTSVVAWQLIEPA